MAQQDWHSLKSYLMTSCNSGTSADITEGEATRCGSDVDEATPPCGLPMAARDCQ